MKTITKHGYQISELTLGTVQLGMPYGINNKHGMPGDEEAVKILKTAVDNGIVSFDTAKAYGKSEAILGQYFRKNPVPNTVITKVEFDSESVSVVRESLYEKIKDSLQILGLSKLPVVLLHNEKYLDRYGVTLLNAVKEVKEEGLVESFGISFQDKSRVLQLTDPAVFDCIQIPGNMLDCKELRDGTIKELADSEISVFVRSVYLQGLFFMNTNELPDKLKSCRSILEKLHGIADEYELSMAQLAVSFMRGMEGIDSLVMGCDTASQLEESISLFQTPLLNRDIKEQILDLAESVDPVMIHPWEWFR